MGQERVVDCIPAWVTLSINMFSLCPSAFFVPLILIYVSIIFKIISNLHSIFSLCVVRSSFMNTGTIKPFSYRNALASLSNPGSVFWWMPSLLSVNIDNNMNKYESFNKLSIYIGWPIIVLSWKISLTLSVEHCWNHCAACLQLAYLIWFLYNMWCNLANFFYFTS